MFWQANKNLFWADKLEGFAQSPPVSAHEEGHQHNQTPVSSIKRMD